MLRVPLSVVSNAPCKLCIWGWLTLLPGRSTLSNEITGDLEAEFGANEIPERAADCSLNELAEYLNKAPTRAGGLGRTSRRLISKMFASKFPGDLGPSQTSKYLRDSWGLGPLRQDALLLAALLEQPETRLPNRDSATAFLDGLASTYFHQEGISLPRRVSETPIKVEGVLQQQQQQYQQQTVETSSERQHAVIDLTSGNKASCDCSSVKAELDAWVVEHGQEYASGIRAMFDKRKERIYDSYWNWCSQDILQLLHLVEERSSGSPATSSLPITDIQELSASIVNRCCQRSVAQLQFLCDNSLEVLPELRSCLEACQVALTEMKHPVFVDRAPDLVPKTVVCESGELSYAEVPRKSRWHSVPHVQISSDNGSLTVCDGLTAAYAKDTEMARASGFSFAGKNFLLTGAGEHSIGIELLKLLLQGGGRVTVTTSSFSMATTQMYQDIYSHYGARGSVLRVFPFNQGSMRDIESLVQQHQTEDWDLDAIIPFAAVSETNRTLEELDSKSEFAHRLMLGNLLRLLGSLAGGKRARRVLTRPATALIPLSPNHGLLGGDGLYSESKKALEPLLAKWGSETWSDYLSIMGVVVGWTRGTSLMGGNDLLAEGVEALGIETFSRAQMAAHLATLLGGAVGRACESVPLVVDLSGGLNRIHGLKDKMAGIRRNLYVAADIQRCIRSEKERELAVVNGPEILGHPPPIITPKANIRLPLPDLPDYRRDLSDLTPSLQGMIDLSRVVVITGFAELGPCGNSQTRWEMEAQGALSLEGCIQMAWMMGLIKPGESGSGWKDAQTGESLQDVDIPKKYRDTISSHSGIRPIEPDMCDGYDPDMKTTVHERVLVQDLPPFEVSIEVAEEFRRKHGDKVVVTEYESETALVQLKAGATVLLPKASHFNRTVAGQIPTGWSAAHYGIHDIAKDIDPLTLYTLVCTVEALLCSGIVDPYELYRSVHVSEIGSCIGSSMGGLSSLRKMHRDRFLGREVQADVLQETFANTVGAWVNMLLLSSTGPIKTPVGACATAIEALDTGYDMIVQGKAKICLVGGGDDFTEDVSYEFGSMRATCDTDLECAAGREPREMSRPMTSSRSGFIESHGSGVQVLTTAELALKLGLPIFGIVAHTSMAADGASRSVPAPGHGLLSNARESRSTHSDGTASNTPPLLDIHYRRQLRDLKYYQIEEEYRIRRKVLEYRMKLKESGERDTNGVNGLKSGLKGVNSDVELYYQQQLSRFDLQSQQDRAQVRFEIGHCFWKNDPHISPIRGSLAMWGLDVDDVTVASLHGTSTVKNDLNETSILQEQLRHLGRIGGNLLPCVTQKWLTGHGKGAAGAWMVNGCLQMLNTDTIPGNPNADNIDPRLRENEGLMFPGRTIRADMKACSVTAFGFGQKGAQALLVHPRYLFATISKAEFHEYSAKRDRRWRRACSYLNEGMIRGTMVSAMLKEVPPYDASHRSDTLLDPTARF